MSSIKHQINYYLNLINKYEFTFLEEPIEFINEYIKFLVLKLSFNDTDEITILCPSKIINQLWKKHVESVTYEDFCEYVNVNIFYSEYIFDKIKFDRTLDLYRTSFKINPPKNIWVSDIVENIIDDHKDDSIDIITIGKYIGYTYFEECKQLLLNFEEIKPFYDELISLGLKANCLIFLNDCYRLKLYLDQKSLHWYLHDDHISNKDCIRCVNKKRYINRIKKYINLMKLMDDKSFINLVKQDKIFYDKQLELEKLDTKNKDIEKTINKIMYERYNLMYNSWHDALYSELEKIDLTEKSPIFVKTLTGATKTAYLDLKTATVLDLRILMAKKTNINPLTQGYVYAGRQIKEIFELLTSYGINKESTLHMVYA